MSYYYNPNTLTFYSSDIFKIPPEGCSVTITDEDRSTISDAMSQGAVLKSDNDGTPYTEAYTKTKGDILREKQNKAKSALDKSDVTILRCLERGIIVPTSWIDYRVNLREIVSEIDEEAEITLPNQPDYPEGS